MNKPMFIEILIDETASMSGKIATGTIAGYDQLISEQRNVENCYITLTKFSGNRVRTPYEDLPVNLVPSLDFNPDSSTNLYDAIGERLSVIKEKIDLGNVLFVVFTDGEDNTSKIYNKNDIARLLRESRNNVNFAFYGAGPRSAESGFNMGFVNSEVTMFDINKITDAIKSVASKAVKISKETANV